MSSYEQSYVGQLRKLVGSRILLTPGVRALIRDERGRALFIRRSDNGRWDMPAGGMELRETVLETLRREVKEETGLDVVAATLIAIYSGDRFTFKSAYGDDYQGLVFAFRVDEWSGELVKETDETTDARFLDPAHHADVYGQYREYLDDEADFAGDVILK